MLKSGNMNIQRFVTDAISGKPLGDYSWFSQTDKKYWDVKPLTCDMIDDATGEKKLCQSDDEFTELANQYMK